MTVLFIIGAACSLLTLWLLGNIAIEIALYLVVWYKYKRSLEK